MHVIVVCVLTFGTKTAIDKEGFDQVEGLGLGFKGFGFIVRCLRMMP